MADDNIKMVPLDSIDADADPKHYYFELPEGLVERIKAFKTILREVELIPLAETIENFKYDSNPEKEVAMWETIAEVYKDYVAENPDISIEEKMEVYKIAFVSCSMPLQFDKLELNFLSRDEALHIQRSINLLLQSKIGKPYNPITVSSNE